MVWFAGFFVLSCYLFQVFEVSQKQTMLVRNQAFMELGNFSDYTGSQHGKDNPKSNQSRVAFSLGYKSGATRVDLDKQETFKKAVAGDLTIDVGRSTNNDYYWETYSFPKQKTKIVWFEGNTQQANIEMTMNQRLGIAHNRSINLNQNAFGSDKPTGLFSGSIQMQDFARLANLAPKLQKQLGLVDDLEALRSAGRQIVKNNPSLADEAAKLEKSLNAADGLTGGLQAALISAVIQTATSFLMQAAGSALSKGGTAANGAKSVGSGAAAQGTQQSAGATFLSKFTDPATMTKGFFNGNLLAAPLNAALTPVSLVTHGIAGLSSGVATGTYLSSGGALSGLSQVGQGVSMGASFSGVNIQELNMASTLAGFPGALDSGISGFFGDTNNYNTWGYGDYVGAFSRLVSPVTGLISTFAPDLALPLGYINTGLSMAGGLASVADSANKLSAGATLSETLKNVGMFTTGIGALYAGVAGLSGKDPSIGGYMMLAGGGLIATGTMIDMAEEMKKKGLSIANPADVIAYSAKKNVTNLEKTWSGFKKNMSDSADTIRSSTASIFSKSINLKKDANADGAKNVLNGVAGLTEKTMSGYDNAVVGVDKNDLSKANILLAKKDLDQMKAALVLNMKYQGVDDAKVEELKAKFQEVQATIDHLEKVKTGALPALDQGLLAKGNAAVTDLNKMVGDYLKQDATKREGFDFESQAFEYSDHQTKAMLARSPNSQKTLELEALQNDETFQTQKQMEIDLGSQGGFKGFMFGVKSVTGGDRTLKADRDQIKKAQELTLLANVQKGVDKKINDSKVAVRATQVSEKISMYGPIASNNSEAVKTSAAKLAGILRTASDDPIYSDTMRARMKTQIEKLDAIAGGARQIISERQWMAEARQQVDATVKELQKQKEEVSQRVADGCFAGNC